MNRERVRCLYCGRLFYPDSHCKQPKACRRAECQRKRRSAAHRRWLAANPEVAKDRRSYSREWWRAHAGYMRSYRISHPEYVERNRIQERGRRFSRRVVKSISSSVQSIDISGGFAWPPPVVKSISMAIATQPLLAGAP